MACLFRYNNLSNHLATGMYSGGNRTPPAPPKLLLVFVKVLSICEGFQRDGMHLWTLTLLAGFCEGFVKVFSEIACIYGLTLLAGFCEGFEHLRRFLER